MSGLCLGFLGVLMGIGGIAYALVVPPKPNETAKAQNNVYYWADGTQLVATGGAVNRQELKYEQIPVEMRNAVISAENKSFETDKGIDPKGIGRALLNMATGGETQGGSTITQQYVKNSMLTQDQTLKRKFQELFITLKVAGEEDKEDVMAGYLNVSYYGRGASGLQAAARTYYNKDAGELNASECAFLATLLKGASYYDPAGAPDIDKNNATAEKNTKRAKERWKWILDEQVKDKRMTAEERAKYKASRNRCRRRRTPSWAVRPATWWSSPRSTSSPTTRRASTPSSSSWAATRSTPPSRRRGCRSSKQR